MVTIIMLVHNAPYYTKHSIQTLMKTNQRDSYELIVVDNDSNQKTKRILMKLQSQKMIDKLLFLKENTLFAKGNNIGSSLCSKHSEYILLLNSDVEIRNSSWLEKLIEHHQKGAITLGVCEKPYVRGDGFAFFIDKDLYTKYYLDESFEWWWSVTKLQAQLLRDGFAVQVVKDYDNMLYHFGGMSGNNWKHAKGMNVEGKEIKAWFDQNQVSLISKIPVLENQIIKPSFFFRIYHKIVKRLK